MSDKKITINVRKNIYISGNITICPEKFLYFRKNYDMTGKIFVFEEKL
jgi:hypothetical protein